MSYPWELLKTAQTFSTSDEYQCYYCAARNELIDLFDHAPLRVLDVGCAGGGTGAEIKRRFPQSQVTGIELNHDAAQLARERLDRVIEKSAEGLDYFAEGIAPASIDTVLFPDVLEHLYDPWNVLLAIRPFLAPHAQIVASIPNIRNFGFIQDLIAGRFRYDVQGLLDITHLRFFTLHETRALFAETGYRITRIENNFDPALAGLDAAPEAVVDLNAPRLLLRGLTKADLTELRTVQFLVVAHPGDTQA